MAASVKAPGTDDGRFLPAREKSDAGVEARRTTWRRFFNIHGPRRVADSLEAGPFSRKEMTLYRVTTIPALPPGRQLGAHPAATQDGPRVFGELFLGWPASSFHP